MKRIGKIGAVVTAALIVAALFVSCPDPNTTPSAPSAGPTQVVLSGPVLTQSKAITLESSNLGENLGVLATHNPESIFAGQVPYLPVLKTALYNGTTPYLTFTFNKAVSAVFGSAALAGDDTATSNFVFEVNTPGTTTTLKRLSGLPVINGATVTFNLPAITDHLSATTVDDNTTFIVGHKYIIDFFVQTTDGDFGQLTVAFMPKTADVALGAFGDANVYLYANTAAGQLQYSLYLIDSAKVFFLNRGQPATHTTLATPDEFVQVGGNAVTMFDTWETRYFNGTAVSGTNNEIFASLDALPVNGRTTTTVTLNWDHVANATEYAIYTTENPGNSTNWQYITSVAEPPFFTAFMSYDFDLSSYPIRGYRVVRIVPMNNNLVGTPGQIRLVDTVRPVTNWQDNQSSANSYTVNTTYAGHLHGTAETDGEIYMAGTRALGTITQPDTAPYEGYQITNITGTLNVTTTATNGGILPLTVAQVTAAGNVGSGSRAFQLGSYAVGVLTPANQLQVYVHLRCYLSPSGAITYTPTDTGITGNISVTYSDLSGNLMISRTSTGSSKNSGVIIYVEN